ncbi:MAG TPA: ABC transporter permease, partial [Vicinamibacteria bacterium]|nr:ABC transporter permease [Vicinamibacteria bacterium]
MRGSRQASVLLLPSLALLVLLFYVPQLLMFLVSLGRRTAYGGVAREASPDNYLRALEPLYLAILGRSLVLATVTTLLCLVVGYPVAWWLARSAPARWRNALLALVILPFWTSFLVRMYAWIV